MLQMVSLMREFPHWAIWRTGGSQWSAARVPAPERATPGQPLTLVHAPDCHELRARIRAIDAGA